MKYCEKCRVSVPGDLRTCPLCQGDLSGQGEPGRGTFPALPAPKHPHRGLLQLIGLGTIAAAAVINEFIAVFLAKKGFEWAGELPEGRKNGKTSGNNLRKGGAGA